MVGPRTFDYLYKRMDQRLSSVHPGTMPIEQRIYDQSLIAARRHNHA